MKLVMVKPIGMAMSWGQTAALGVLALEAKSGALVMRVNMLLKQLEMLMSICQLRSLPERVAGWEKTGPMPPPRVMDQPKKANPMMGPMTALARNHQRSLWIGTQMVGRERSQ